MLFREGVENDIGDVSGVALEAAHGLMERVGVAMGGFKLRNTKYLRSKSHQEAPVMHREGIQECTKDAPRRHQGGTREAPRRHLHIDMGPRAAFKSNKVLEHITVDRSGLI